MDPFYFLDIESAVKDENDNILELYEFDCCMYPNGSWSISTEDHEGSFIFNNKRYKRFEFNNDNKKLFCYYELEGSDGDIYNLIMIKEP